MGAKLQVYCISGLGADRRIFSKLKLENAELHFIDWTLPEQGDTMRSYALTLAKQVKHQEIVLVGVSFGGMLATDLTAVYRENNLIPGHSGFRLPFRIIKTFIISTCSTHRQFPLPMRWASYVKLHKAAPYSLILRNSRLNRFVFDLKSRDEELYLKRLMLDSTNLELIKRSVDIIFNWKAEHEVDVIHIHGTADRLFPARNIKADHWVKDGGHFMVWNRAREISRIMQDALNGPAFPK
jgi:pimeloyl-ACP methyl ester carboxylesterase